MDPLTIILTSYNRPHLLRRTLESLLGQNDPDWRCLLVDDGSGQATLDVIQELARDPRFDRHYRRHVGEAERTKTTRFSVLLNEKLAELHEGVVGYLCDNVEYEFDLTETVNAWFHFHPDAFAGYVPHKRDMWLAEGRDGIQRLGDADEFGHWKITPPKLLCQLGPGQADGRLDHAQVFHRLPTSVRWPEEPEHRHHADGLFFERLVRTHGPIHRITAQLLTYEHLIGEPVMGPA